MNEQMNQFINEQMNKSKSPRSMIYSFDQVLNSEKFQICKSNWNSRDSIPFSEDEGKNEWVNGKMNEWKMKKLINKKSMNEKVN